MFSASLDSRIPGFPDPWIPVGSRHVRRVMAVFVLEVFVVVSLALRVLSVSFKMLISVLFPCVWFVCCLFVLLHGPAYPTPILC